MIILTPILVASALISAEGPRATPRPTVPLATADPEPSTPAPSTPGSPAPESLPGPGARRGLPRADTDQSEILVTARPRHVAGDPLQDVNARSFAATQAVDEAFIGPVSHQYERRLPRAVRDGLRNVLYNLREPSVFLSFLVQLKPGKAVETFVRFALNSTIGGGGLVDVAKRRPFKLPRRLNGFADTLGYYGVKPGPFMFLPLLGPTTLRDLVGDSLDRFLLPLAVGAPFNRPSYTVPAAVLTALDHRAEFDEELQQLRDTGDPYTASRDYYLQRRQAEIEALRGTRRRATSPTLPATEPIAASAPLQAAPEVPIAPETAPEVNIPIRSAATIEQDRAPGHD